MRDSKIVFSENLQMYLNKKGVTAMDMSRDIDVPQTTVSNWICCNSYPRNATIEKVAEYFGVDKLDLIRDHNQKSVDVPALFSGLRHVMHDDKLAEYTQVLYDLDENQRDKIYTYIDFIKHQSD